jgi:hypothetical protein
MPVRCPSWRCGPHRSEGGSGQLSIRHRRPAARAGGAARSSLGQRRDAMRCDGAAAPVRRHPRTPRRDCVRPGAHHEPLSGCGRPPSGPGGGDWAGLQLRRSESGHLDIRARLYFELALPADADWEAEVDRLISLGATHTDTGEGHGGPALMLDPDGNEFSVQRAPVAGSLSVSGDRRGESGPLALLSPCPRRGLRPLPLTWKQRLSGGRARYGLRSGSRPRRCSTR